MNGYVIIDMPSKNAIWGYGKTESEAWDSLDELNGAIHDEDELKDMEAFRATPELIAEVELHGGNIAFFIRSGTAQLEE